jgi:hypothetical protein
MTAGARTVRWIAALSLAVDAGYRAWAAALRPYLP